MFQSEILLAPLSRRSVLIGATGLASARLLGSAAAIGDDPRQSAMGQAKLNATLDGSPAFWAYAGTIYAVRSRVRPVPLLALSGLQANWAMRQADGSYRLAAPLLSFFRDVDSGAFLDVFVNPFTQMRNPVRPNFFAGKGYAVYPADGSAMRISGKIDATESAPQGFKPAEPSGIGRVLWSETRDSIVLNTDQFFNVQLQPQGEAQTRTADRDRFFDPRVKRLPARFSATTISPWLAWMDMGTAEGHLVWHTSGEKVFSVDDVPADYRVRAGQSLEALTSRPRFEAS